MLNKHIDLTHKLKPETWEPSWVFSSLNSISNPSFGSFPCCILGHPLLSSSTAHPSCQATISLEKPLQPPVSFLICHPCVLFPRILHQSARLMIVKPCQIRWFCCLNSVFQLYHLLSRSSVTCVNWHSLFPPKFQLMPCSPLFIIILPVSLSFFNNQPPSCLEDCWNIPSAQNALSSTQVSV